MLDLDIYLFEISVDPDQMFFSTQTFLIPYFPNKMVNSLDPDQMATEAAS